VYEIVLYLCALAVVYTYAGYPVLIALWSKLSPRPTALAGTFPQVAIVVVAHNEEARIAAKLKSCLEQDYPADRFRVVVALDGSSDGTRAIVESFGDRRVDALAFPIRRGKAACLNDAAAACNEDILVFTDARQALSPQAVRCLVENLADATVGAVSGELMFVRDDMSSFAEGVDAYWRYEKFIRRCEAAVHSVPGVTGALYAIRRACFLPIPTRTILDDVAIPMQAVRAGYRVVFDARAVAYDKASQSPAQEKVRKVRTLAGNYQILFMFPWLLLPLVNPIFLQYFSHKVMRLVAPFAMLGLLLSNAALAGTSTFFSATLVAQSIGYAVALATIASPALGRWRVARLASTFLLLNWYAVLGLVRFLADREAHLWQSHSSAKPGEAGR
jgi:cellulose synthase/poly-beta-1,6-N-acetylglucosamine synthase-like glycosyltransferase